MANDAQWLSNKLISERKIFSNPPVKKEMKNGQ